MQLLFLKTMLHLLKDGRLMVYKHTFHKKSPIIYAWFLEHEITFSKDDEKGKYYLFLDHKYCGDACAPIEIVNPEEQKLFDTFTDRAKENAFDWKNKDRKVMEEIIAETERYTYLENLSPYDYI